MKVFTDFHHQSLFNSLIMLFEGRLGYEIYRPIGMEWFEKNYWRINGLRATAEQFLQFGAVPNDGTPPLNESPRRTITFEEFKDTPFDILVASIPQHVDPFKELILKFQPQAKLIYQIGNQWQVNPKEVKNVMASAKVLIPQTVNGVIYHQEFDTNIFRHEPPQMQKKIYSFVNCLNTADLFKPDWELFCQLEALMPDWEFKSFGGQCRDGWCNGDEELANKMREAAFIFHCKTGGDGYGHVIHNAASVGRPLITRQQDYFDKLAQPLIEQASNIRVDNKTAAQIAEEIDNLYNDVNLYKKVCETVNTAFKRNVNFDREEQQIRKFLDNLV